MPSRFRSPERLDNPDLRDQVLPESAAATGLLVVDEAHRVSDSISDWGHGFRPAHRRLRMMPADLPPGIPVPATTAPTTAPANARMTANAHVTADAAEQPDTGGGTDAAVLREPLDREILMDRESLTLGVLELPDAAHRMARLADHLDALPGSGITTRSRWPPPRRTPCSCASADTP